MGCHYAASHDRLTLKAAPIWSMGATCWLPSIHRGTRLTLWSNVFRSSTGVHAKRSLMGGLGHTQAASGQDDCASAWPLAVLGDKPTAAAACARKTEPARMSRRSTAICLWPVWSMMMGYLRSQFSKVREHVL